MQPNPFIYGNPVFNMQFIGRTRTLRRVVGRILNLGQSTAIVGEPKIGKTSLLKHISSEENRNTLYGKKSECLHFSSIDLQLFGGKLTQTDFWRHALSPLLHITAPTTDKNIIADFFNNCEKNKFNRFSLEDFFLQLKKINRCLVLCVDEFDMLIQLPVLNTAEFFGGMRSLSSTSKGSLCLIIASRTPLSRLNKLTQDYSTTGSPFFNIFSENTLGPFKEKEINHLLSTAQGKFEKEDIMIIKKLAGGHPYLIQAAGAAMWDAYEEEITDCKKRAEFVMKQLYQQLDFHFTDTWRAWTPDIRKAFTCVALIHNNQIINPVSFDYSSLINQLRNFIPELNLLEERGLISKDNTFDGKWVITSEIILTWLADKILKSLRDDMSFEKWLQEEQMDGVFTSQEKDVFHKAVKSTAEILEQGASTMMDMMFPSCFISYSHKDEEFVRMLYERLKKEGVKTWYAPEDMAGGKKIFNQIKQAVSVCEKILFIFSEHSMKSNWVVTELFTARLKEKKENYQILFPIRLVDMDTIKNWECFDSDSGTDIAREIRSYHILDFCNWKDQDTFEDNIKRLLKDLKKSG